MMRTSSGVGTPYFYEYELGLIECLNMLYDKEIDYVTFQDPRFQSLDDVVVSRNGKLINIQIKHTSIDENMTFSFFWGENENSKSLLNSLMSDWYENCGKYEIDEIRIYSNKSYGVNNTKNYISFKYFVESLLPQIKNNYLFEGTTELEKNTIKELKRRLEINLGNKSSEFISLLSFYNTPPLDEVLALIKEKIISVIGVTDELCVDNAFNLLQSKLVYWTTNLRKDVKVCKEDVYSALKEDNYDYEYSFSPQLPIYPSRLLFAKEIEDAILNEKKFIFIQGKPGIGKTNFVSYLSTKKQSLIDFRFYTYYPAEKCNNIYSDDYGKYSGRDLWISLLLQLRKYFENNRIMYEYSFPLVFKYLSIIDIKKTTLKFLRIFKERTGRCNILIDGLDHAVRYNHEWNKTYLSEIPSLDELPEGVKFIFSGQPDYNYPSWIIEDSKAKYMPDLSLDDIIVMLDEFNNEKISKENMAKIIKNEVGTDTLNVYFAIKELSKLENIDNIAETISLLRNKKLNSSINHYYEWIYNSFSKDAVLKQLVIIFGFTNLKLDLGLLSSTFDLDKLEMLEKVNKLYPLICIDCNEKCYVYHNDVRLFFKNKVMELRDFSIIVDDLLDNKLNKSFLIKHNILVDLLVSAKKNVFYYYNLKYLKECMNSHISFECMYAELKKVAQYITHISNVKEYNILNLYLTTINQMYNVKKYYYDQELTFNEKDNYYLSEIYNYDPIIEYSIIIDDIYRCILKCDVSRARYIYEKYVDSNTLIGMMNRCLEVGNENDKYCFGYVLRYMGSKFDIEYFDRLGYKFIEGWINSSKLFPDEILNNFVCMKEKYYPNLVDEYIDSLIKEDKANVFYQNIKSIIKTFNCDIYMYVKLYEKYKQQEDLDYLRNNLSLLIPKHNTFNGEYSTFIKVMLLINDSSFNYDLYDKLHDQIREVLEVGKGNRAFPITEKIYNSAIFLHKVINKRIKYKNKDILDIFDNVLFAPNQHGTGSAHDCDYYLSSKVIYSSIYEICVQNESLKKDMVEHIISIYGSVNKPIVWELIPLMYDKREKCMKFVNYWIKENGYLWLLYNSDLYFVGTKIVEILHIIGYDNIAQNLKFKLEYKKNIGFINDKDYSLSVLYKWMKGVNSGDYQKLITNFACIILSLNDYANETGNNRFHSTIEKELIKMSIYSGPNYLDAVFSLKNTPKDFYYWRMNASEVIGDLEKELFSNFADLFIKWDLHKEREEDFSIDISKWIDMLNNSWDAFVTDFDVWINEEKNHHKSDTLVDLFDYLSNKQRIFVTNKYIINHLINRSKYGYEYDGFDKVIEKYYLYISSETFHTCLQNLLTLIDDFDFLYNIQKDYDIIIRCLAKKGDYNYFVEFENIIEMYKIWVGHPDLIDVNKYKLLFDSNIKDFDAFVNKQLCK